MDSDVLSVLRGAARELGAYRSGSQPGTPTTAAAAAAPTAISQPQVLLQIAALHKAFLALSEAFLEEQEGRQAERQQAVQQAASLQAEVAQLAAAHGQQAHRQALLTQRCSELEQEVARLKLQLEDQQAEAAEALQQQVEGVAARLDSAAEQAVQRWAAEVLPQLLQPMHEAVAATADLAASVAAEVACLAEKAGQLADRCGCLKAAHGNHEQRLCHAESCAMASSAGGGPASIQQLETLAGQVQSLQAGHARLDETLQALRQQQSVAASLQPPSSQQSLEGALGDLQAASIAAAELPSMRRQLAALADQQVQQAGTAEVLQSVLADVAALARHTKALDKEMRALRKKTQHTEDALLQSSAAFSKALQLPSPVGPFTSFPPQL